MNLTYPIVYINGTSVEALIEQRCAVYDAVNRAMDALAQACPNGRDYYPVPGLMEKAQVQHERRMQTLKQLLDEMQEEVDYLESVKAGRNR